MPREPDRRGRPVRRGPFVAMAGLCALVVAGCLGPQWTGNVRPTDWQQGVALESYSGGKTHNGNEGYHLRPLTNGTPVPTRCVAYQNAREDALDHCTVYGPGGFPPGDEGQARDWVLVAAWDGTGERLYEDVEMHPEGRTVVAFDANGGVVGYWDGLHRGGGPYWTE